MTRSRTVLPLALLAIVALSLAAAAPPGDDGGTKTIHADLADPGCGEDWRFEITGLQGKPDAPDSIRVNWSDGAKENVTRDGFQGGDATYRTDAHAEADVTEATAEVAADWNGSFSLTDEPCGDKVVHAQGLDDHECDDDAWQFVINQVQDPPSTIHVNWSDGTEADVDLDATHGPTAHYNTTRNLDVPVEEATARLARDWDGEFNLGEGPCLDNAAPTVTFTYAPADPTTRDRVAFDGNATDPDGNITSWSWDLGDGNTSSVEDPDHGYADDGTYNVTVTIVDDDGATANASKLVDVANVAPTLNVSYTPSDPTTIETVNFTGNASDADGEIASWSWAFGDGNTSSEEDPSHRYDAPGSYTVNVTVTDDDGAATSTQVTVDVTREPRPEIADRTGNATTGDALTFAANLTSTEPLDAAHVTYDVARLHHDDASGNVSLAEQNGTYRADVTLPADATGVAYRIHARDVDGPWNATDELHRDVLDDDAPSARIQVEPTDPDTKATVHVNVTLRDNRLVNGSLLVRDDDGDLVGERRVATRDRSHNLTLTFEDLTVGTYDVTTTADDGSNATVDRTTFHVVARERVQADLDAGSSTSAVADRASIAWTARDNATVDADITYASTPTGVGAGEISATTTGGRADTGLGAVRISEGANHTGDAVGNVNVSLTFDADDALDPSSVSVYYWNGTSWVDTARYVGEAIPGGGPHVFDVHVDVDAGRAWAIVGHTSTYSVAGSGDATAPGIENPEPTGEAGATPRIAADLVETGSGIDASATTMTLDGTPVDATVTADEISFEPSDSLDEGPHSVTVHAVDEAGNEATRSWEFDVDTTGGGGGSPNPGDRVRRTAREWGDTDAYRADDAWLQAGGTWTVRFPDVAPVAVAHVQPNRTLRDGVLTVSETTDDAGVDVRTCLDVSLADRDGARAGAIDLVVPVPARDLGAAGTDALVTWTPGGRLREPADVGRDGARLDVHVAARAGGTVCLGVDRSPPRVASYRLDRSGLSGGVLDVRFDVDDNRAVESIVVRVDGRQVAEAGGSGTVELALATFPEGVSVVEVVVRDVSGWQAAAEQTILVPGDPADLPAAAADPVDAPTPPGSTTPLPGPGVAFVALLVGLAAVLRARRDDSASG